MDNPLEFVKAQGWEHRIEGDQIRVKVCPLCKSDDEKFYIHIKTGMWDCKHLNKHGSAIKSQGNIHGLRKALGLTSDVKAVVDEKFRPLGFSESQMVEQSHLRLLGSPMHMQTLMDEWRIDEEAIRHFKLGIRERNGAIWLVQPHIVDIYDGNGPQLYNVKFKTWFGDKKEFARIPGGASVLLQESLLHAKHIKKVVLCEGEKDLIVAWSAGIRNAIGMTGGAGTLKDRWYDLLEHVEEIVIAYDGDAAGEEGTQKLIQRLGVHRVKVAAIPAGEDVADIVAKYGKDALHDVISKAKFPDIPNVKSIADVAMTMLMNDPPPLLPTYSYRFNEVLNGGFRSPQLITLTAPPKIGKTSFAMSLGLDFASRGIPTLNYCMEMSEEDITTMACGMYLGVGRNPSKADYWSFANEAQLPLYLGFKSSIDTAALMQTFRDAYTRFGLGIIIFDNIHYMVRNISGQQGKVEAMENAYKALKIVTIELKIPIVVIAQPKKINVSKGADMNYYDVAWTGAAASDSDSIVILHRERSQESDRSFSQTMMVKADAGRFTQGGRAFMQYREKHIAFRDLSYGEQNSMDT